MLAIETNSWWSAATARVSTDAGLILFNEVVVDFSQMLFGFEIFQLHYSNKEAYMFSKNLSCLLI